MAGLLAIHDWLESVSPVDVAAPRGPLVPATPAEPLLRLPSAEAAIDEDQPEPALAPVTSTPETAPFAWTGMRAGAAGSVPRLDPAGQAWEIAIPPPPADGVAHPFTATPVPAEAVVSLTPALTMAPALASASAGPLPWPHRIAPLGIPADAPSRASVRPAQVVSSAPDAQSHPELLANPVATPAGMPAVWRAPAVASRPAEPGPDSARLLPEAFAPSVVEPEVRTRTRVAWRRRPAPPAIHSTPSLPPPVFSPAEPRTAALQPAVAAVAASSESGTARWRLSPARPAPPAVSRLTPDPAGPFGVAAARAISAAERLRSISSAVLYVPCRSMADPLLGTRPARLRRPAVASATSRVRLALHEVPAQPCLAPVSCLFPSARQDKARCA